MSNYDIDTEFDDYPEQKVPGRMSSVMDASTKAKNAFQSLSGTTKIMIYVTVVLIVFYIIYIYVKRYLTNRDEYPVLLQSPIRGATFAMSDIELDLTYPTIDRSSRTTGIRLPYVNNSLFLVSEGVALPIVNHQVQFTISFWMRPENMNQIYKDEDGQTLYSQLLTQNRQQFAVLYDGETNTLAVRVRLHSGSQIVNFKNTIRLQSWQHIAIILDNRNVDLYIDGVFRKSRSLKNVPQILKNTWQLFPGSVPFVGLLSCIRYFNYSLNRHEIYRLHKRNQSDPPTESRYMWWTWYRGNSITAIFYKSPSPETPVEEARRQQSNAIIPL